jgi:hypothetical protein
MLEKIIKGGNWTPLFFRSIIFNNKQPKQPSAIFSPLYLFHLLLYLHPNSFSTFYLSPLHIF